MTAPSSRRWQAPETATWVLRALTVAAIFAVLIVGILCVDHVTSFRVAVGFIATAVTLICLTIL